MLFLLYSYTLVIIKTIKYIYKLHKYEITPTINDKCRIYKKVKNGEIVK